MDRDTSEICFAVRCCFFNIALFFVAAKVRYIKYINENRETNAEYMETGFKHLVIEIYFKILLVWKPKIILIACNLSWLPDCSNDLRTETE